MTNGDVSSELSAIAAMISAFVAYLAFDATKKVSVSQIRAEEKQWKKSNTFALIEQWNGPLIRPARSEVYRYLKAVTDEKLKFADIYNDKEIGYCFQALLHFFDEAGKLYNAGYLDEAVFSAVTAEPMKYWLSLMKRFAPEDGDDTIRFEAVVKSLENITGVQAAGRSAP